MDYQGKFLKTVSLFHLVWTWLVDQLD